MDPLSDTFRNRFPSVEVIIIATRTCPGFEDYIKGKRPGVMTRVEVACVLNNFLYPLLHTVHEQHIRDGIMEEIEEFNKHLEDKYEA